MSPKSQNPEQKSAKIEPPSTVNDRNGGSEPSIEFLVDALPTPIGFVGWSNLPNHLDGSTGRNRGTGLAQVGAQTDIEAVAAWLAQYQDSPATFASYRKEAERLVLWATLERNKPLSSLHHEDLLLYRAFLADPKPVETWVQTGKRLGRGDPGWRPFAGPLSPTSIRQSMIVLNGLLSWLVQAGYLTGNPLALSRHRRRHIASKVERYLDTELWGIVTSTVQNMPLVDGKPTEKGLRSRWLITLLYLAGLRISEVCENTMGGFSCRRSIKGEHWWLDVVGKGNKQRTIPATPELISELIGYRKFYNLPPLPSPGEQTPLILPLGGKRIPLQRAMIHNIVKDVFEQAAQHLEFGADPSSQLRAERLRQASAHWLRHTSGSHMADSGVDLRFVRDNLGHENLATTSGYLHTEDDPRYQATIKALHIGWGAAADGQPGR